MSYKPPFACIKRGFTLLVSGQLCAYVCSELLVHKINFTFISKYTGWNWPNDPYPSAQLFYTIMVVNECRPGMSWKHIYRNPSPGSVPECDGESNSWSSFLLIGPSEAGGLGGFRPPIICWSLLILFVKKAVTAKLVGMKVGIRIYSRKLPKSIKNAISFDVIQSKSFKNFLERLRCDLYLLSMANYPKMGCFPKIWRAWSWKIFPGACPKTLICTGIARAPFQPLPNMNFVPTVLLNSNSWLSFLLLIAVKLDLLQVSMFLSGPSGSGVAGGLQLPK